MSFHINPDSGEPGDCSAQPGNCPFGGADAHYTSAEAARSAFEEKMAAQVFATAKTRDFSEVHADIAKAEKEISDMALGKNHNKAIDKLTTAVYGVPSRGFRGGRNKPVARTTHAALSDAKRLIGPKGNPVAYARLGALISELENTPELKNDLYFQAEKAIKGVRLPKDARRVKTGASYMPQKIVFDNGNFIQVSEGADKTPVYVLRKPLSGTTSGIVGANSDLQALLKGDMKKLSELA